MKLPADTSKFTFVNLVLSKNLRYGFFGRVSDNLYNCIKYLSFHVSPCGAVTRNTFKFFRGLRTKLNFRDKTFFQPSKASSSFWVHVWRRQWNIFSVRFCWQDWKFTDLVNWKTKIITEQKKIFGKIEKETNLCVFCVLVELTKFIN